MMSPNSLPHFRHSVIAMSFQDDFAGHDAMPVARSMIFAPDFDCGVTSGGADDLGGAGT